MKSKKNVTSRPNSLKNAETIQKRFRVFNRAIVEALEPRRLMTNASLPFVDDFNRTSGTDLGQYWTETSGDYSISSNKVTVSSTYGQDSWLVLNGTQSKNIAVSADFDVTNGDRAGVFIRGNNGSSYVAYVSRGIGSITPYVAKYNAGTNTWTSLANGGYGYLYSYTGSISLVMEGSELGVYINGNLAASAQDTSFTSDGSAGIYTRSSSNVIDNFSANELSYNTNNVSLPFTDDFNRSISPALGSGWTEAQGDFVRSGTDALSRYAGESFAFLNGVSTSGFTASVKIDLPQTGMSSPARGIVSKAANGDMYLGQIRRSLYSNYAEILKKTGSTWTTLASYTLTSSATSGTMSFQVSNGALGLIFNGAIVASATDSSPLSNMAIGIYAANSGVHFDDYSADDLSSSSAQNASLPFTDDFGRASSISLGDYWTDETGDFVLNGTVAQSFYNGLSISTLNGIQKANASIAADITLASGTGSWSGFVLRKDSNAQTYYLGRLRRDANNSTIIHAEIVYVNSGSESVLADSTFYTSPNGRLLFQADGDNLSLLFNNSLISSAVNSSLTSGNMGLASNRTGSTFDNVSAASIGVDSLDATLPFSDDFGRDSGTSLGEYWTETSGDLQIADNTIINASSTEAIAELNGIHESNLVLQAYVDLGDITGGASSGRIAAIDARTSTSGFYRAQLRFQNYVSYAEILRYDGSGWTTLDSRAVENTSTGTIRFELNGSSLHLYLNGTPVALAEDTTFSTGGVDLALKGPDVSVDDFVAKVADQAPTHTTASLPLADDFDGDDTSILPSQWIKTSGEIFIGNSQLQTLLNGESSAELYALSQADVSLASDFDLSAHSYSTAGLDARISGNTRYRGQIRRYSTIYFAEILKEVNGTWTTLDSREIDWPKVDGRPLNLGGGTLRFDVNDDRLGLYLDDHLISSATNTDISSAGSVGIYGNNAAGFDNVSFSNLVVPTNDSNELNYSDDFDHSDNAIRLGPGWDQRIGNQVIFNNAISGMSEGDSVLTLHGVSQADAILSASVSGSDGQQAGLIGRFQDANNYYSARVIFGQSAQIEKVVNGTKSVLATATWTGLSGTLRLELEGTEIQLFIDDVLVTQTNDSAITNAGGVGLLNYSHNDSSAQLDNFSAKLPNSLTNQILSFSSSSPSSVGIWSPGSTLTDLVTGDFNGDGRDDIAGRNSAGDWLVGLSTGIADFTTSTWGNWSTSANWLDVTVGDVNADGRADIVGRRASDGVWEVAISSGSSFSNSTGATWSPSVSWAGVNVADFTGDGRDDIAGYNPATGQWIVSASSGTDFTTSTWAQWTAGTYNDIVTGDFDGDNRADVAGRDTSGHWHVGRSSSIAFGNSIWATWSDTADWQDVNVGDFNGDGKQDLIARDGSGSNWTIALSNGAGFTSSTWTSTGNLEQIKTADLDGDGRTDLLGLVGGSREWRTELSNGTGFTDQYWTTTTSELNSYQLAVSDFRNLIARAQVALRDVYNNVDYEPYSGFMKGAEATEQTGRGNAWDQSALLISKLQAQGIQARFVTGRVQIALADVLNWLGAKDGSAAEGILDTAGLDSSRINAGQANEQLQFNHAWVEAYLPGPNGVEWRQFDPAIKKIYYPQQGITGLWTDASFSTEDYQSQYQNELPIEWYEDQVNSYITSQYPGKSIADVGYTGQIIAQYYDALPTTLPFILVGTSTSYSALPSSMMHRVRISVADVLLGGVWGYPIESIEFNVPDISLETLSLTYTQDANGLWMPELRLDGKIIAASTEGFTTGDPNSSGQRIGLQIDTLDPGDNTVDRTIRYDRQANQDIVVMLDADQVGNDRLTSLRSAINSNSQALYGGDTSKKLNVYLDGMSLAAADYIYTENNADLEAAQLNQLVKVHSNVSAGIIDSNPDHEEHWDLAIPIVGTGIEFDIYEGSTGKLMINDSTLSSHDAQLNALRLIATNRSMLESYSLERIFNGQGISAVSAIQYSNENGIPVYEINSTNISTLLSQLTVTADIKADIQHYVNLGYTATVPRDIISLTNWSGTGARFEKITPSEYSAKDALYGDYITSGGRLDGEAGWGSHGDGSPRPGQDDAGDPVNLPNGSVVRDDTDFSIPNTGFALEFSRNYISTIAEDIGMGDGWSFSYSDSLSFAESGDVTWRTDRDVKYIFVLNSGLYQTPDGIYGQLTANEDETYTYKDVDGISHIYNSLGKLIRITDLNNNSLNISYDENGNLDQVSDGTVNTRWLDFTWSNGHISNVTDFTGRTWTYDYVQMTQASDNSTHWYLSERTSPSDSVTSEQSLQYGYYESGSIQGLLKSISDPSTGKTIQFQYYANRAAFSVTDPEGNEEYFSYDRIHRYTDYINPDGLNTSYAFNDIGLTTKIINPDQTRSFQVWDGHLVTSRTDELGRTETYEYNDKGNPTEHVSTDGVTTTISYDSEFNKPLTITETGDRQTQFEYDSNGNLTSLEDAGGNITTFDYDERGRVVSTVKPNGNIANPLEDYQTTYTYSDAGQILTQATDLPSEVQYTYDSRGNVLTYTDATGRTVVNTYDLLGQILSTISPDPDGSGPEVAQSMSYAWSAGKIISQTNALGQTLRSEYDGNSRQVQSLLADGSIHQFKYDGRGDLIEDIDPNGQITYYIYDDRGRLVQTVSPDGSVTMAAYDAVGNIVSSRDAEQNVTQYEYDAANRLTDVVNAVGDETTYNYNDVGQLDGYSNVYGTYTYTLDALGRITQTRGPDGYVTTTDYDADGNIVSEVRYDVDGLTTIPEDPRTLDSSRQRVRFYQYDVLDRLVSTTNPNNDTATVSYDDAGRILEQTDELGRVTSYAYDNAGNVQTKTLPDPDGSGPLTSPVTSYSYDAAGNLASVTDPDGNTTSYAYDSNNRLISQTDAIGNISKTVYDAAGRTVVQLNPRGNDTRILRDALGRISSVISADPDGNGSQQPSVTSYIYDGNGNIISMTDADNNTTTYQYDGINRLVEQTDPDPDGSGAEVSPITSYAYSDGNLQSKTDPLGNVTTYEYDDAGRLTQITEPDPDGSGPLTAPTQSTTYNSLGQIASQTDASGKTTTYEYDSLGRETSVTGPDPDGSGPETASTTQYQYDAVGNLLSVTDSLGFVTSYSYDNLNRQISETQPDPDGSASLTSPQTYYTYDAAGNLLSRTDPDGNTTTYTYDAVNRVQSETDANSHTTAYTYDSNANLTSITDRNGKVREFTYDALNRKIREQWRDEAEGPVVETINYTYDTLGRLTAAGDSESSYSYSYDELGRLISESNAGTVDLPTVVLNRTYNAAGQLSSVSATVNNVADFVNEYEYDNLGRVTSLAQSGVTGGSSVSGKLVEFSYNALGQVTTIDRYSDLTETQLVAHTSYGMDDAHRVTSISHINGSTIIAAYGLTYDSNSRITQITSPDGTVNYSYDNNGQLTSADDAGANPDYSYSYDSNGNRTNSGYSTDTNNELSTDGTYSYQYDAEGNRSQRTTIATGDVVLYTWDARNRLTDLTYKDSSGTTTSHTHYVYDVFDRRIGKYIDSNGDGNADAQEHYVYDIDNISLIYDGQGNLVEREFQGPGIDNTFATENNSGVQSWYLGDQIGSVRDVVDKTGTVLDHIQYDPYGQVVSQSNSTNAPRYFFANRELDSESGLYYNRARYFDSNIGQFIGQDPLGFGGEDSNLYRYGSNNPLSHVDPTGLFSITDIIHGVSGAIYSLSSQLIDTGKLRETYSAFVKEIDTVKNAAAASAARTAIRDSAWNSAGNLARIMTTRELQSRAESSAKALSEIRKTVSQLESSGGVANNELLSDLASKEIKAIRDVQNVEKIRSIKPRVSSALDEFSNSAKKIIDEAAAVPVKPNDLRIGNPAKSNAAISKSAAAMKTVGRTLTVAVAAYDIYHVASSKTPTQFMARANNAALSWAGILAGMKIGAGIGTMVGGPLGGLIGGIAGGFAGGSGGSWLSNSITSSLK